MKKVFKQEGRLLTIVVVGVTPAVAVTVTPATAGAPGVAVANHERRRGVGNVREKVGKKGVVTAGESE